MQIADGGGAFWEYWHNHTVQKTENGYSAKAKQVRSLTVFLEKSQCTILSFTYLTYLPTLNLKFAILNGTKLLLSTFLQQII